jgi:hypothetical protein
MDYFTEKAALEQRGAEAEAAKQRALRDRDIAIYKKASTAAVDAELKSYDQTISDVQAALRGAALAHAEQDHAAREQLLANKKDALFAFLEARQAAAAKIAKACKVLEAALAEHHVAGVACKETLLSSAVLTGLDVQNLLTLADRASGGTGTVCFALYEALCPRRSNIDPPCRSNTDPGMDAGRMTADCG